MNASFTCKISTIKMVRFIFLLKQAMPRHFCFCYLLGPRSWGRPLCHCVPEPNRGAGGAGAEWWWGSARHPSRPVTPQCLWKPFSLAFPKGFANGKVKEGQSSVISLDFKGAFGRVGFGRNMLLLVVWLWQWIIWASWALCQQTRLFSSVWKFSFPFLLSLPLCLSY